MLRILQSTTIEFFFTFHKISLSIQYTSVISIPSTKKKPLLLFIFRFSLVFICTLRRKKVLTKIEITFSIYEFVRCFFFFMFSNNEIFSICMHKLSIFIFDRKFIYFLFAIRSKCSHIYICVCVREVCL